MPHAEHRASDDESDHSHASSEPRVRLTDVDVVSETALARLTLDELRARVRELYEAQRAVERERDALRAAQGALVDERRTLVEQRISTPPSALTHDINNMLGVIIGHVGMALRHMRPSDPLLPDLEAIQRAAERAAALMRELRAANGAAAPAAPNAATADPAIPAAAGASASAASHQRTVLLVEDEPAILTLVTHILRGQGYNVLRADSATAAIAVAQTHSGAIDLLLTDVMMPEMNGRDLSRALLVTHPGLRTVFMSGYTADLIATDVAIDADVSFLQKPFSIDALVNVVSEALRSAH